MNDKTSKRSRSSNWSETEKTLLTELIKEKIQLIENKDVTKNNNQLKKIAWQEILRSYNEMSDTKRDLPQLMNQWRNTKNNIKKRNFEYRRKCNATGGGPRPPSPPPEDVEIMEILPNEFNIDHNQFDSDSLITKDHAAMIEEIIVIDQPLCSNSLPPTQSVQTPKIEKNEEELKAPKKLFPKKTTKRARASSRDPDASNSHELFLLAKSGREQQIKQQKIEHEQRIKLMLQEYDRRVQLMEDEHEVRLQVLAKEKEYWEKRQSKIID